MWVALAIAMSANGIFRELVLKRFTSPTWAALLSAILGIAIIAIITRIGFRPVPSTASTQSLAFATLMLVLFTVVFETLLGVLVDHKSAAELVAHYALWHGELWPIVLAFLACTPFLWVRWLPRSV